jgi:phosphohistidine phosphatase
MDVFLVRHADAGEPRSLPKMDAQRHLTTKGKRDAKRAARFLGSLDINPVAVVTSPLPRARETAGFIFGALSPGQKLLVWDELAPGVATEAILEKFLTLRDHRTVIMVGHEPSLSILIRDLIGLDSVGRITLSKGGIAKIMVTGFAPKVRGKLKWLLSPKLLKRI